MEPTVYPINDFGPLMKGLAIGALGIFHVFTAQFAIGGGFLLCYLQRLAMTGRSTMARLFLDGYFKFLVLISFVVGALTGVGMWFTSIQVSPATIGLMVEEFHWLWAIEWTFFSLEVVAGYAFYRYGAGLNDRARLALLALYTTAAWFSLFWINGILSWQLTPGSWTSGHVWAGFFNPSFWPSLFYRTIASLTIASLVALVLINFVPDLDRAARADLIRQAARLMLPMLAMPILGIWYLFSIPEDSRDWILGGSPAMTLFFNVAAGASTLIGVYALWGIVRHRLYVNAASASLLVALAFGAQAGGEFVREGARKPYTVRETLYSNSVRPDRVAHLRRVGVLSTDPYPLRNAEQYPTEQIQKGAKVYRQLCSVCHPVRGANGLVGLTTTWDTDQKRLNIAKLQRTKPFMPPFAGSPSELEALVQYLSWENKARPTNWPDSLAEDEAPARLQQIERWLAEAGTEAAGRKPR